MKQIKSQIRAYIDENLLFASNGTRYDDEASLLEEGIVDSVGVMELVAFLEDQYDVDVEDHEIVPENFDSVNSLARYVSKKLPVQ